MTGPRTRVVLAAGRAAGWASRVTGRGAGSQISGRVMLGLQPDLLADVVGARRVALVSATNGKTTTTRLLAEALRANGTSVATNHTGANMPAGIAAGLAASRRATSRSSRSTSGGSPRWSTLSAPTCSCSGT